MKTLVIANQKGGVGKTCTLVHLAFYFAEAGFKIAVVDLDTQANASFTLSRFDSGVSSAHLFTGDPVATLAVQDNLSLLCSENTLADIDQMDQKEAVGHFVEGIQRIESQGFDICLIDTAPSLNISMLSALFAADYVASPIELEAYSMQGIDKMLQTIEHVRMLNKKLEFLGMIPSKVDGRNARHQRHLTELATAYPDLVASTPIGYRSSIADALASHRPVWAIKKTAARVATQEMRAMAARIQSMMEIA